MSNVDNNGSWIVKSHDNNVGGAWIYKEPEFLSLDEIDDLLSDQAYNSMVDFDQFKTEKDAEAYFYEMNEMNNWGIGSNFDKDVETKTPARRIK